MQGYIYSLTIGLLGLAIITVAVYSLDRAFIHAIIWAHTAHSDPNNTSPNDEM